MTILLLWLLVIVGATVFVVAAELLGVLGDCLLDHWQAARIRRRVRRSKR